MLFDIALFLAELFVHYDLTLLNLHSLLVSRLLVARQLNRVELLLVIQLDTLLDLSFHVLKSEITVQLNLSRPLLCLKDHFFLIDFNLFRCRLLDDLTAHIIFCAVLTPHLIKISLFLLQLNIEFILNLEDLALFVLHQVSLIVIDVCAILFTQLLNPTVEVFLSIRLNLCDIRCELLLCTLNFI